MGRMDGRTAIVSGGARGMGVSHARALVGEGARVVIGDVLHDEGRALADELGGAARYVPPDVTDEQAWASAFETARGTSGSVDVLVNNAAIVRYGGAKTQTAADSRMLLEVNPTGTFLGMRAALPLMREQGRGSVVNISSIAGFAAGYGPSGYTASKWGIRGLTKTEAPDMAGTGVRVNSVHPGIVRSVLSDHLTEEATAHQAIPRQGEPEEITRLVLFLACDDSSFTTGAEFVADGGALLGHVPTP